ncbi:MAG: hypothetical protein NVS1B13_01240 [Flavisolibacter sp.]
MNRLLLLVLAFFSCTLTKAQLLSWSPLFPTENDSILITVDGSKGNQGLFNYTPTGDVYVYVGVITNLSSNAGDWRHIPFAWASPPIAAQTINLGNNKWAYSIKPSLRSYFGLTDPSEIIQKIAILFRNGNGNTKQANKDGSDMFIPVYGPSLAVRIDQPFTQPKYNPIPEPQNDTIGSIIFISANSNKAATLSLYQNGSLISGPSVNVKNISTSYKVTSIGNQQFVVVASDGVSTKRDTLNVFVAPPSSPTADLPLGVRDGINYESGDTTAILVLRAPGKNLVTVIGDFNNWTESANYVLNKTTDGKFFWIKLHLLTPGIEYAYQYKVDNSLKIADPYTEKILDPDNDPFINSSTYPNLKSYPTGKTSGIVSILQTAPPAYNWNITNYARPDKKGLVIYELLLRDFIANHDWKTLRDSLNYFRGLGINAIEIMPLNEFEGNDSWGYNPDFYLAPDKYYGPKNTLKEFIDSCHRSGIAVIMDIALNHSFGSSPMVQLYFDQQNIRPASNNPWFNPVTKHAFNVGYDMNHESPDTKYFVSRVLENWLQQYKVDGFRFDLAKGFTQKQTCDASGNNCDIGAFGAYDLSRVKIWKGYYDTVQIKSVGAYAILEHFADNSEEKELSDYGMLLWGNMSFNYAQASLGYSTPDPNGNAPDFTYGIYSNRGWTKPLLVSYMESHDEERIMYKNVQYGNSSGNYNVKEIKTGLKRIELDAAFFYTIPGPKMLWQFGELGYDYSINTCTDGTISNHCRLSDKPIRWDYYKEESRRHVHDAFASLIQLRFHPLYQGVFISGTTNSSLKSVVKWLTLSSSGDTSDLVVVGNFDVNPQTAAVVFPTAGTWYDYFNNQPIAVTAGSKNIPLQPGEYRLYLNRNLKGITLPSTTWSGNSLEARIFPNPVKDFFTLELKVAVASNFTVDMYNSIGQFIGGVYRGQLPTGINPLSVHSPTTIRGNYYLKIAAGTTAKTIKLTIQ